MDVTQYFQIVSTSHKLLHIELKGFWSDHVVDDMGEEFLLQFREGIDKLSGLGKFIALVDMSEFEVLSAKAKNIISKMMDYAGPRGTYKAVEVMPKALTSLGLKQAAEMAKQSDFRVVVKSLAEGKAVIEKLKQEI